MKLASLKGGGRDGALIVVSDDLTYFRLVPDIARTMQAAIEIWDEAAPRLAAESERLNGGDIDGASVFDQTVLASPLPRAFQWVDGSAYVNHVELVRKARGAELPESFWTDPLMYQGVSDGFLGPYDPIPAATEDWGVDLEGEVAVITDDVPMGVAAEGAGKHIKLIMLCNDVSLRNLIPAELAKGFGFLRGKPASSFSPVAVTPEALAPYWDGRKLHRALVVHLNGAQFGHPDAGEDMTFDFPTLIAHAAKTRRLGAGTIIGSGTVSNADRSVGSACLAEKRMLETIETGEPTTPFLRFGDRVRIEMFDDYGRSIFGAIDQEVVQWQG